MYDECLKATVTVMGGSKGEGRGLGVSVSPLRLLSRVWPVTDMQEELTFTDTRVPCGEEDECCLHAKDKTWRGPRRGAWQIQGQTVWSRTTV